MWLRATADWEFIHFLLIISPVALNYFWTLLFAFVNLQQVFKHSDLIQLNEIKHSLGLLLGSLWWKSPFSHLSCTAIKLLSFHSALVHAINFLFPVPLLEHAIKEADRNVCTSQFSHLLLYLRKGVRGITGLFLFFYYAYGFCFVF